MKPGTKKSADELLVQLLRHIDMPPDLSDCWNWTGCINSGGRRPTIVIGGQHYSASRIAWAVYRGEIPHGLLLYRTCRNFRCVNPEHLKLVTRAQNAAIIRAILTPARIAALRNQKPTHWKFLGRHPNGRFFRVAA